MADERLEFILAAKNLASGEFNKVDKDLKTLGTSTKGAAKEAEGLGSKFANFAKLGLFAGAGVALGVGAAFVEMGKKATEDEAATTRLTQALKDNVAGFNGQMDVMDKAIDKGMDLGFSDDQVKDAMGGLLAVTHNQTDAVNDMALAEDLSRARNIDLATSSKLITEVLAGNMGQLSRYGIIVQHGATVTQALGAIQKMVGGQAEAFANTTAGATARLQAKWEDLQEKLGSVMLPIFKALADFLADNLLPAIENIADGIGDWVNDNQPLIDALGTLAHILVDVLGVAFQGVVQMIKPFIDALGFVGSVVGNVVGAVQTAVTAITGQTKQATDATKDMVLSTARDLPEEVISGVGPMNDAAEKIAAPLPAWVTTKAKDAVMAAKQAPKDIASALTSGYDDIDSAAKALADAMKNPLSLAARQAKLQAELNDKNLAAGLKSNDPVVRAQAEALKQSIVDQMNALVNAADTYGVNTGKGYAAGLNASQHYIKDAAKRAVAAARGVLQAFSPPGPESPLHEIDTWGENTIKAYVDGMARAGSLVVGTAQRVLSGVGSPSASSVNVAARPMPANTGHSHAIIMDGQVLARAIDRRLYYLGRTAPRSALAEGAF